MVDLSLVENQALMKDILSKPKNSWSERLGNIKATHHTIDLYLEHALRQQPYRARRTSREMICEYIAMQLDGGVIKSA